MKTQTLTPETKTRPTPRPAGMGVTCDAWHETGLTDGPRLRRCRKLAWVRMTILAGTDCYDIKRCPGCAAELRGKAQAGATFEILAEAAL